MINIREYEEEMPVEILEDPKIKRWVIHANNEGGFNYTTVDLLDVIDWIKKNKPELLK